MRKEILYTKTENKKKDEIIHRHQNLRDFSRKILMMQEEERKRFSRDLHDETGQLVIALGASINVMEKELNEGNIKSALSLLSENRKQVQEIAEKMKSLAVRLRPPALDILGLAAVLREYFSQCSKSYPVKIEFNENIKDKKLNEEIEIALYRVIQEAVYNVFKHSTATSIKIELMLKDNKEINLLIEDNGKGFDTEEYQRYYNVSKTGLRIIEERIRLLNGDFLIESDNLRGTRLEIKLPLWGVGEF